MPLSARFLILPALVGIVAGCATAPPPAPPVVTFEQKMAWILRLEDERILRVPAPPAPAPAGRRGRTLAPPPPVPDLGRLVVDDEARVRRRSALAIGRVGLAAGVPLLVPRLADDNPEVRQMAAFALGLIGDRSAVGPLAAALKDPSLLVQGRAAFALGLIGDRERAAAIGEMVAAAAGPGGVAALGDDAGEPLAAAAEAFRLGVFALARLGAYDALAAVVLDRAGLPAVRWWPAAYALAQVKDPRAVPALVAFAGGDSRAARGFAARGLGALKDPRAIDVLQRMAQAWQTDPGGAAVAVGALAGIADARAAPALLRLLDVRDLDPNVRLEVVRALGALHVPAAADPLLNFVSDPWPAMRAASLEALRDIDRQTFLLALSSLDPDRHWSVRAALARILGTLDAGVAVPRLTDMLADQDQRVIPAVLRALVALRAPDLVPVLTERLKSDDVVIRATAAEGLGVVTPAGGDRLLADAYAQWESDPSYVARAAALAALTRYGAAAAIPTLTAALADRDFAVRVRAAGLLHQLDPAAATADRIRPAPGWPAAAYEAPDLVAPTVSPLVFIETAKGTIEIELAVLDAPITCQNFIVLARKGFFNGLSVSRVVPGGVVQDGDPRGDGEGGPGYTIRDELNERPCLRGTVGMALDWADTGGSRFFITGAPQPHLDARSTVFGSVVAGMDVVDRLQQWDVISAVRVWDGRQ